MGKVLTEHMAIGATWQGDAADVQVLAMRRQSRTVIYSDIYAQHYFVDNRRMRHITRDAREIERCHLVGPISEPKPHPQSHLHARFRRPRDYNINAFAGLSKGTSLLLSVVVVVVVVVVVRPRHSLVQAPRLRAVRSLCASAPSVATKRTPLFFSPTALFPPPWVIRPVFVRDQRCCSPPSSSWRPSPARPSPSHRCASPGW